MKTVSDYSGSVFLKRRRPISILVFLIGITAVLVTLAAILSDGGQGKYEYISVRGDTVSIYGKGLYKHMSAEVAPQGIAQDYITLLVAVPLLFIALFMARKESLKGRFLLAGTLGYFLVTYLFYLTMGMYNELFLTYVFLAGASFFAFILTIISFDLSRLHLSFQRSIPVKATGRFLMFNSIAITLMWLGIVVPPLLDGSIIPVQVEHYTTLIVQGLDLAILLPSAFIIGQAFSRRKQMGYLFAPIYFVFLSILMTALTAKIIAMLILGYNVIPAIFIIPIFNACAIICTAVVFKNIKGNHFVPTTLEYDNSYFSQQS
jgi:hypothetical protein